MNKRQRKKKAKKDRDAFRVFFHRFLTTLRGVLRENNGKLPGKLLDALREKGGQCA